MNIQLPSVLTSLFWFLCRFHQHPCRSASILAVEQWCLRAAPEMRRVTIMGFCKQFLADITSESILSCQGWTTLLSQFVQDRLSMEVMAVTIVIWFIVHSGSDIGPSSIWTSCHLCPLSAFKTQFGTHSSFWFSILGKTSINFTASEYRFKRSFTTWHMHWWSYYPTPWETPY